MPRSLLPALIAAVMMTMLAGCASGPFPAVQSALDSFNQTLRSLPGVEASSLDRPPVDGAVKIDLIVTLTDDVTEAELADIGDFASTFPTVQLGQGQYPGAVELRLAGSAYSYFDLPTPEALHAQLAYWRQLVAVGFESISTRTYSAPVTAGMLEATDSVAGDPSADRASQHGEFAQEEAPPTNSPGLSAPEATPTASSAPALTSAARGRLVVVELSSDERDDGARTAQLLDAARSLDDPGAATGEWDLMGLAPFTTGQFVQSALPTADQIDFVRETRAVFDESDQLASVHVRVDDSSAGSTQVNVTAFDDTMEGVKSADAAETFRETAEWSELMQLVPELQQANRDFSVNFVGNNLTGLGVFELKFGVRDCGFWSGSQWPDLSRDLEMAWAASLQGANAPTAAAQVCAAQR
ncbi:hypothetical protein [Pseudoclavibacter sp. RFBA6]|uniref:hypothetical protein n=1 Tax=Pseudoclavibacter sp. RFBA6 TaxID=2080573 RepID=UPI000CE91670|nr:hypothetical protein [Pseudoclavibacter sp. RFBA6]PPG42739.1 hypothetical protein C5C17_02720 [Pseudoclavibacter sp. RFBA6]